MSDPVQTGIQNALTIIGVVHVGQLTKAVAALSRQIEDWRSAPKRKPLRDESE